MLREEIRTSQDRHYLVRLEIGVSAQFAVDTHKEVTYENLVEYFNSKKFLGNMRIPRIINFLDDSNAMGCKLINYCNPLSSTSIAYVEFEVEVPEEKTDEFKEKYARYYYLY